MKICWAARHPLRARAAPHEEMPEQPLGQWQTRREGKKTLAIFCRFLFNLETKSGFVRGRDRGCAWKFLGFSP